MQREAREDGLLQGRQEGKQEDAIKLRRYGLSPAEIVKALEIPESTVMQYLKQG